MGNWEVSRKLELATVIPVPKPGKDHTEPNNYRPIALTSCLCKTLERMINVRLVWYLESNNLISPVQSGFRSERCTNDNLVRLETFIRDAFVAKEHVVAVFFDLEKAYDTTWRYGILRDLHDLGIRGRLAAFIESFLADRWIHIRVGSTLSEQFDQAQGVPQGSILSTTLFNIKINSIMDCLDPKTDGLLYVDDFCMCYRSKSMRTIERHLQQCINRIEKWASHNGFKFSKSKTQCVHFCQLRKVHDDPELYLYGSLIPVVEDFKFLGVLFDRKLSFIPHIKYLKAKCLKALNLLKVLSHTDWGADRTVLLQLYRSIIRSKLDYGSIVYGSARKSYLSMLDTVHHQGLRLALGAFRTSPVESLYVEAEEPSLYLRREKLTLQYAIRLAANPSNPAHKVTFPPYISDELLVPADKAANNVVVVCRLHYVNTLKQELDGTRAYLETDTDEVSVVNAHLNDLPVKFSVCVNEGQDKLPTMYWLPKLHKRPYKARFIANSSSCTTTELSKLLTSCLTAIKSHVIRYCETVYETSNKNWFWSIKNSGEVLSKLKCRGFRATSLSTYDFSTLYTTLPHNLIKEKLLDLIEWTFKRALKNYGSLYLACNNRKAFFTSSDQSRYTLWSCQNVCDALSYLLDNIYIRFGTKLYRQIVGIPMGTNCAPLVADLFLYCYERDFMDSLNHDNQADVIEAFNSTSRYLDDLLNIDNPYFEGMVNQIYPPELQLNKANISDTEAPFLDLHLSVANGFVSSKIYDKRDDFDFDIVNFPFLDGDVPRLASYGVYISQLIRFARVCNHVTDFNARNKCLTAKLLQQGYRYHKLRKAFSKFYRRHYELISKYNVGLKTLLSEGLSEPEFYGDLVYKLKKLKGINDFSLQFGKIISRYRRIGYNLNVMRQSACLVFNPIMVDNYAAFFNCTPVGRASDSMMAPT